MFFSLLSVILNLKGPKFLVCDVRIRYGLGSYCETDGVYEMSSIGTLMNMVEENVLC